MDTIRTRWQKSSYCAQGDSCLHVAASPDHHVRLTESSDPSGAILTLTPAAFENLIAALKSHTTPTSVTIAPAHDHDAALRIHHPHAPTPTTITTTPRKWHAFALGARAGEFDHLLARRPSQSGSTTDPGSSPTPTPSRDPRCLRQPTP
ncbi:DUF397 domain-containing protein [Streptomyces sp. HSG2]|uniref:DUF397 domain-containing protein n=1 Tax=Streptomyces sp. HSG2 TaxID=2797167 RepID=UPI00190326E6|nr:DUF397 domain-containing protein [Streptomyces sp. HSG2]